MPTDPEGARGLPESPGSGVFVARLEVDRGRLGEVSRAIDLAPVFLCGSEMRDPTGGAVEQDIYLEYSRVSDVMALLERLGAVARRVTPVRVWCAPCGRWHPVTEDGLAMRAPEGAACRER